MSALAGIRVLDLGIITAGAATSQVFADFGADVVKIESSTYQDPFRAWNQVPGAPAGDPDDSPPFRSVNRGKRGVALDLKTRGGRQAFLDLVATADLVVENYRRGVLERLDLTHAVLRAVNPRIVLLSLSSQGLDGPEARYVSFGSTLEALGGSMAITGYDADSAPVWTGNNVNYPDQLVSLLAPGVALAAVRRARATGTGAHVDLAQREAVTDVVGETVVRYSRTGDVAGARGARVDDGAAWEGILPARGADAWIAITAADEAQWWTLVDVLRPDLPGGGDLDVAGRARRREEVEEALARATATWDRSELADRLQRGGVAASPVQNADEVLRDPQLAALGFPTRFEGDDVVHRGVLGRLDGTPGRVARPAPRLGQHTTEVLSGIGYSADDLHDLQTSGAIFCAAPPVDADPGALTTTTAPHQKEDLRA